MSLPFITILVAFNVNEPSQAEPQKKHMAPAPAPQHKLSV